MAIWIDVATNRVPRTRITNRHRPRDTKIRINRIAGAASRLIRVSRRAM
jgi:hypothetical protein